MAAIRQLRQEGVPVLGYTWFPLFTMIDWRYRYGKRPVEDFRLDLGLYTQGAEGSGPRWEPTPLVEQFRKHVADPGVSIGEVGAALRA